MSGSPSARLIAQAQAEASVTDAQGRVLRLRRLTALDKLRLFKAAGPVLAQNQSWLGLAALAFSVAAIDDVPVPVPASEAQIEALVARLGDAGIAAAGAAMAEARPSAAEVAATAGN
jgi:hypothetical protein